MGLFLITWKSTLLRFLCGVELEAIMKWPFELEQNHGFSYHSSFYQSYMTSMMKYIVPPLLSLTLLGTPP